MNSREKGTKQIKKNGKNECSDQILDSSSPTKKNLEMTPSFRKQLTPTRSNHKMLPQKHQPAINQINQGGDLSMRKQ